MLNAKLRNFQSLISGLNVQTRHFNNTIIPRADFLISGLILFVYKVKSLFLFKHAETKWDTKWDTLTLSPIPYAKKLSMKACSSLFTKETFTYQMLTIWNSVNLHWRPPIIKEAPCIALSLQQYLTLTSSWRTLTSSWRTLTSSWRMRATTSARKTSSNVCFSN